MSDSGSDTTRDDEPAGAGADEQNEDGNQGNRDNLINTLCRLCAVNGYQRGAIHIDSDFHEVELTPSASHASSAAPGLAQAKLRATSWMLDDSLDSVPSPAKQREMQQQNQHQQQHQHQHQQHEHQHQHQQQQGADRSGPEPCPDAFASQADAFAKLQHHCLKRFALKSRAMTVVAVGPGGAGKSYRCVCFWVMGVDWGRGFVGCVCVGVCMCEFVVALYRECFPVIFNPLLPSPLSSCLLLIC